MSDLQMDGAPHAPAIIANSAMNTAQAIPLFLGLPSLFPRKREVSYFQFEFYFARFSPTLISSIRYFRIGLADTDLGGVINLLDQVLHARFY